MAPGLQRQEGTTQLGPRVEVTWGRVVAGAVDGGAAVVEERVVGAAAVVLAWVGGAATVVTSPSRTQPHLGHPS